MHAQVQRYPLGNQFAKFINDYSEVEEIPLYPNDSHLKYFRPKLIQYQDVSYSISGKKYNFEGLVPLEQVLHNHFANLIVQSKKHYYNQYRAKAAIDIFRTDKEYLVKFERTFGTKALNLEPTQIQRLMITVNVSKVLEHEFFVNWTKEHMYGVYFGDIKVNSTKLSGRRYQNSSNKNIIYTFVEQPVLSEIKESLEVAKLSWTIMQDLDLGNARMTFYPNASAHIIT